MGASESQDSDGKDSGWCCAARDKDNADVVMMRNTELMANAQTNGEPSPQKKARSRLEMAVNREKFAIEAPPSTLIISGATGDFAETVNGVYKIMRSKLNRQPLYQKEDDASKWLAYFSHGGWFVTNSAHKDANNAGGWLQSQTSDPVSPVDVRGWLLREHSSSGLAKQAGISVKDPQADVKCPKSDGGHEMQFTVAAAYSDYICSNAGKPGMCQKKRRHGPRWHSEEDQADLCLECVPAPAGGPAA